MLLVSTGTAFAQDSEVFTGIDATEIVRIADLRLRGASSYGETTITIVRPSYSRTISMVSWSKGDEYSLILVLKPSRDAGSSFLKRGKEIWNWIPTIERTVKLPPSMMSQNWMGTDFTNDDLVQESSIVSDYQHRILGKETFGGLKTWKIELIPLPDAAVVWGRILSWIDEEDYMQMKAEFYDEDGILVNTMVASEPTEFGNKRLPAVLEMIPAEKKDHRTIMRTSRLEFNFPIEDRFFTVRNMKSVRPRN